MSVNSHLIALREALRGASPALAARLSNPASRGDIAALEAAFGRALPAELRAFYATSNGDGPPIASGELTHGLLFGATAHADWIRTMRWLSAEEATKHLYECRDTFEEAFRSSWIPIATDDSGNVVIVEDSDGSLHAIDHEAPGRKGENRIASSIEEMLLGLVSDLESGTVRCGKDGFYRTVVPAETPREPASMLLALLLDRQLLEMVPGSPMAGAVKDVRTVLGGEGSTSVLAQKLGELLDSAPWVDETFASDEVLEVLVREFR